MKNNSLILTGYHYIEVEGGFVVICREHFLSP